MTSNPGSVLVFDDDDDVLDHAHTILTDCGHAVSCARTFDEFRAQLGDCTPDLILLDLAMPGTDGVETLRYLAGLGYPGTVALISALNSEVATAASALGELQGLRMAETVRKPYSPELLLAGVETALSASQEAPINAGQRLVERDVYALVNSGFLRVFYQPKRRLSDGKVSGFEALARCWHPDFGMLKPASFLQVVEGSPLLERLTAEVIGIALADMKSWAQRGHRIRVAINLAAKSLSNLGLPDKLRALARRHGIALEDITIEVTETTLSSERVTTLDVLTRLRIMGVALAIDDFGSGYSNESRLSRMPFSELKIDRELVGGLTDTLSRGHIDRCLALARSLRLNCVAEGVENAAQYAELGRLGVDEAQGFFVAKPMPAEAVLDWLIADADGDVSLSVS